MNGFWDGLITVLQIIVLVFLLIIWAPSSILWILAVLILFVSLLTKLIIWIRQIISR